MKRTGMFAPGFIERLLTPGRDPARPLTAGRSVIILATLLVVIVGTGFVLRAYTVHSLPVETIGGVDVLTISESDIAQAREVLPVVLADSTVASKLSRSTREGGRRVLAYFIPIDYVMQGMIANTGDDWKLFEQHKTIGMITEYILHPFSHLTEGHAAHMAGMQHGPEMYNSPVMKRRIIFIAVSSHDGVTGSPADDFNINGERTPLFFVDAHLHTNEILRVEDTPSGSGWGTVPMPMF